MTDVQWRRGPDDSGIFERDPVALGFRRLSILDLSPAGHQPFLSSDESLAIVFNGEIFNYLELRDELIAKGHRFRSGTDTEVLLASYQEWGLEMLPRLNGMWAFLIVDFRQQRIFVSRDRFGVKPLFLSRIGGAVCLASEIKALREVLPGGGQVNWSRVDTLLARGRLDAIDASARTFVEEVEEFPPAHGWVRQFDGTERRWAFWTLPSEGDQRDDPQAPTRLGELLADSVRLRLRSDVPVGVALSGGMDSSTILSLMGRQLAEVGGQHQLLAFSYMAKEFDESAFISDTVRATGATLHQINATPAELWDTLDDVLAVHDEPLHSPNALAGYQVYGLAARHGVRVVLGGQGADESLGGYPSYFPIAWQAAFRRGNLLGTMQSMRDFAAGHQVSLAPLALQAVRSTLSSFVRPAHRVLRAEYATLLRDPAAQTEAVENRASLSANLAHAVERRPLPLFLRVEDRNSMGHSVEARLPFLDYRIVQFAFTLSDQWKIRGRWNKYVLREATRGVIPESVRTRVDKMGFPTGFSTWIRGPLADRFDAEVAAAADILRERLAPGALNDIWRSHRAGQADHGMALFHCVQVARWLERHVAR